MLSPFLCREINVRVIYIIILVYLDITNQGTLPLVESCSGTKMLLAHHLRTGGLKCPCINKSIFTDNIHTIFLFKYHLSHFKQDVRHIHILSNRDLLSAVKGQREAHIFVWIK